MKKSINSLINHHFCIKHRSLNDVIGCIKTESNETITFNEKFDWNFIFSKKAEKLKRFILFEPINDWTYLRWNIWNFEEAKLLAQTLSKELNTEVNYFFIDPWIFTARWIHSKNGKLIRTFYESHDQILEQSGELKIEKEIRKELSINKNDNEYWDYWEDKYWELNKKLNPPITVINEKQNLSAIIGEINKNWLQ